MWSPAPYHASMSNPPDSDLTSGTRNRGISNISVDVRTNVPQSAQRWFSEAINRHNLTLLAMISAFLAGVDTFQSFYLQRVVNQFNEANLLPLKFYNNGILGYLLYSPIDFLALYGTLTVLWIWASYLLWYYKRFVLPRLS
jgi:hypothetical protein